MNYSLDEAAILISEKVNKNITARQIREIAISGLTNLSFLYRGKATNCNTDAVEEIYGWPYVLPGHITEIEMKGNHPANMFIYNETVYKILSPDFAVNLTKDSLLINEERLDDLIKFLSPQVHKEIEPKFEKLQIRQERLILEAIATLGYDKNQLPQNKKGHSGVPKKVREHLYEFNKLDFIGTSIFDKAWGRLLSKKEIVYRE